VVDSAIYKLRTKLSEAASQIVTIAGFGYSFIEPPTGPGSVERTTP
jgi:DNA-binding response OmpR family regulator